MLGSLTEAMETYWVDSELSKDGCTQQGISRFHGRVTRDSNTEVSLDFDIQNNDCNEAKLGKLPFRTHKTYNTLMLYLNSTSR